MVLAIRDAEHPLTPKEISAAVDRDVSNVAVGLERLVDADLLERLPGLPRPMKQRGKWPKHRYGLSARGRAALDERAGTEALQPSEGADDAYPTPTKRDVESLRAPDVEVGLLQMGAQLVFADATAAALPELFHVLAAAEPLAEAAWTGVADGDPQEYLIVFTGDDASAHALDLLAVLAGARIDARRVAIGELRRPEEFGEEMTRRAASARHARLARDTREAS